MPAPKLQTFGPAMAARKVIPQSLDYAHGAREIAHIHHRAQLVYATRGIVRIMTPDGLWIITPAHALLIGSQVEHELHMLGEVSMRTLYIDPTALAAPEPRCRPVACGELLRAALLDLCAAGTDAAGCRRAALLEPLMLDVLDTAARADDVACLPLPADARLRHICTSLIAQAANNETLEEWAANVGASARTIARHFRVETGLSFGEWREQLRISEAKSRLAIGHAPVDIARELGYADSRTFAVMFRRASGVTPQQFLERAPAGAE
ncbi:AraC-like DNA-binding protein [Paraburkholderia eburnea]|uniref:AraC-like DNA-binding protein n=1 Tax=Paraburkholderia eburnea TaxID=1189126 RepID=A0A2S4LV05_9BURK|nr:helix-turn-helix transcriptional regulator [Paraburkholderia eburnea]POR46293.1 AraC-like DNA-binding protein [Paraburkholderia eburnea]PRZ16246.1 AraC-like DNA-binding protein [Paraburkholderia eburnea]